MFTRFKHYSAYGNKVFVSKHFLGILITRKTFWNFANLFDWKNLFEARESSKMIREVSNLVKPHEYFLVVLINENIFENAVRFLLKSSMQQVMMSVTLPLFSRIQKS